MSKGRVARAALGLSGAIPLLFLLDSPPSLTPLIYSLVVLGWFLARPLGFARAADPRWAAPVFFLLMLASTSVWLVRNQSLHELWWLFMSLMRYPREVFNTPWTSAVGWFFTFIIPVTLATNVPASAMVKVLQPWLVAYAAVTATALLALSRWVFRRALRSYRSASS